MPPSWIASPPKSRVCRSTDQDPAEVVRALLQEEVIGRDASPNPIDAEIR
jgi:hypothetical protein